jgi:hypothetical protein
VNGHPSRKRHDEADECLLEKGNVLSSEQGEAKIAGGILRAIVERSGALGPAVREEERGGGGRFGFIGWDGRTGGGESEFLDERDVD